MGLLPPPGSPVGPVGKLLVIGFVGFFALGVWLETESEKQGSRFFLRFLVLAFTLVFVLCVIFQDAVWFAGDPGP